ncbi:PilX N-terminal domain-containing pilus assembly protein [Thermodesulfovibrionales bacterium]|nr:PilX N-terminal domain-containing pilus assembly protein [Thermodesulfovibrionales bacterium]
MKSPRKETINYREDGMKSPRKETINYREDGMKSPRKETINYREDGMKSPRKETKDLVNNSRLAAHCSPLTALDQKGVALITVLFMIVVVTAIGIAAVNIATVETRIAANHEVAEQAFYVAEAGIAHGLNWLRDQSVPPTDTEEFYPLNGAQTLGAGEYEIRIDPADNNPNVHLNRYRITSISSVGGATRTIAMEVEVESFSRFAHFTNTEYMIVGGVRRPVWFTSRSHLTGPIHTNSYFRISGDPIFDGPVSSVGDSIVYARGGPPYDNPDFRQGLQLGVAEIEMPGDTADLKERAEAQGGLLLTGNTAVELLADGTMNVTNARVNQGVTQNMPLPTNGVLYVQEDRRGRGNLFISGILNGQLTVGSDDNIIITGNIRYHTDPRIDPTSQDMLGLVAEDNVIVSRHAGHDVEINASIMAIDGSFFAEGWWWRPPGTLTVYGGIIQDSRGPVGTTDPRTGQGRSGFANDYHYDLRLMNNAPPFFPTTGDYVVLSWKEER